MSLTEIYRLTPIDFKIGTRVICPDGEERFVIGKWRSNDGKMMLEVGPNPFKQWNSAKYWGAAEQSQFHLPLKTSYEWKGLIADDIDIIDHDGWDRSNFQYSFFEEKITEKEFIARVKLSTISWIKFDREDDDDEIFDLEEDEDNDAEDLKSSYRWHQEIFPSNVIVEPKGWNRNNIAESYYDELITRKEFLSRWENSTTEDV